MEVVKKNKDGPLPFAAALFIVSICERKPDLKKKSLERLNRLPTVLFVEERCYISKPFFLLEKHLHKILT